MLISMTAAEAEPRLAEARIRVRESICLNLYSLLAYDSGSWNDLRVCGSISGMENPGPP